MPSPALARFKPYLRLEPSARAASMISGVQETWRHLEDPRRPFIWYERALPFSFRRDMARVPGIEGYAVARAADLPPRLRSKAWTRLLAWLERYPSLALREKTVLLKLLSHLGLYHDNERLLAGDSPSLLDGRWDETQSQYAFLKMVTVVQLHELDLQRDYSAVLDLAERAAPGTLIRFMAAIKHLVLCLENGVGGAEVRRSDALARGALRALRGKLPRTRFQILESKYWRACSYFPFLDRDLAGVRERLGRADARARAALKGAKGPEERAYAEENLYAVSQTRGVAFLRLERLPEAIAALEEMTRYDPLGAWQRFWLGMALEEAGRPQEARQHLLECWKLGPPFRAKAAARLARAAREAGRAAEARLWEARLKVLGEAPQRLGAPPSLSAGAGGAAAAELAAAEADLLKGNLERGWKRLHGALRRDSALLEVLLGPKSGSDARAALARLDKAVRAGRARPGALAWRGLVRLKLGDKEGAAYDLERALEKLRAPGTALKLALAEAQRRARNKRCLAGFDAAAAAAPRDALAARLRDAAQAEFASNKPSAVAARGDAEDALDEDPNLAIILSSRFEPGAALEPLVAEVLAGARREPGKFSSYEGLKTLYRSRFPQDQIAVCRELARLRPKRAWSWALLGRALLHGPQGEAGGAALAALDRAVTLAPQAGWLRAWRAQYWVKLKAAPKALQELDEAIRLQPGYARAHAWRGAVLRRLGRAPEALADLERAAALDPGYPFGRQQLSLARRDAGDFAAAARELDAAFRGNAQYSWATDAHSPEAAERQLDAALEKAGADASLLTWRGQLRLARRDFEGAGRDFAKAQKADPRFSPAHAWDGRRLTQLGRPEQALAPLRRALAADPSLLPAAGWLAEALEAAGRAPEAVKTLRALLADHPRLPWALTQLGELELRAGRKREALALARRSLEVEGQDARAYVLEGEALLSLDDAKAARAAADRAVYLGRGVREAWRLRAEVCRLQGEAMEADACDLRAAQLEPPPPPPPAS